MELELDGVPRCGGMESVVGRPSEQSVPAVFDEDSSIVEWNDSVPRCDEKLLER